MNGTADQMLMPPQNPNARLQSNARLLASAGEEQLGIESITADLRGIRLVGQEFCPRQTFSPVSHANCPHDCPLQSGILAS
jgi:hypothetical protein